MHRDGSQILLRFLKFLLALTPIVLASFVLYQMNERGVWDSQTPLRDLASGGIVAASMAFSFVLYSRLTGASKRN